MQAKRLAVVFALDDPDGAYWLNTAVAVTSVAQYAMRPVDIHILHSPALPERVRQRLVEVVQGVGSGSAVKLSEVNLPPTIEPSLLGKFGPASLYRLLIPHLFRDRELVIYLDSDLVCNGLDINEFGDLAPVGAPLTSVADRYITVAEHQRAGLRDLGLDPAAYVNSGVLALRPPLIQDDLVQAFAAFFAPRTHLPHPDQDFLNVHFAGRIALVDERFNYAAGAYDQRLLQPLSAYAGKVVHYSAKLKPLDGVLAPGFLPFWIHAHRTPELNQGIVPRTPNRCALPHDGDPNALVLSRAARAPVARANDTIAKARERSHG